MGLVLPTTLTLFISGTCIEKSHRVAVKIEKPGRSQPLEVERHRRALLLAEIVLDDPVEIVNRLAGSETLRQITAPNDVVDVPHAVVARLPESLDQGPRRVGLERRGTQTQKA